MLKCLVVSCRGADQLLNFLPVGAATVFLYLLLSIWRGVKKHWTFRSQLLHWLLLADLLAVIAVTLFPLPIWPAALPPRGEGQPFVLLFNVIPFDTLRSYLPDLPDRTAVLNLAGNIVLFVPIGMLGPLLFHQRRSLWRIIPLGFGLSFLIELIQLALSLIFGGLYQRSTSGYPFRSADVDDLLLNTTGVAIGYGLMQLVSFLVRRYRKRGITWRLLCLGIPALCVVVAFGVVGWQSFAHATPQRALTAYDSQLLPFESFPFAEGVVLITNSDPYDREVLAAKRQGAWVAWYLQRENGLWGYRVRARSLVWRDVEVSTNGVSFQSMHKAGQVLFWGEAGSAVQQVRYRFQNQVYVDSISTDAGIRFWHIAVPETQASTVHDAWSLVLKDGAITPLFK